MKWSPLLLLPLLVLLSAASPRREYLNDSKEWTRVLKIYRGFDTALILRATYLDAPMRSALAQERQRLSNPSPDSTTAFDARMKADNAAYHDVVFSASTPMGNKTFGETDAGWVIWMEADGTKERLVSLERIRRPTSLHEGLYPHYNIWSELWIARFERTVSEPDKVVLHVGSGFGNGDLKWSSLDKKR